MLREGQLPGWASWFFLACGVVCAIGFLVDFVILGNGSGTSGKVFSFVAGFLSCSLILTFADQMSKRRKPRVA